MTFTSVTIKKGSSSLARTTGFWSKKQILVNRVSEPTMYLLNESLTTSDLLNCISSFIDANLRGWIVSYYQTWVPTVLDGEHNYPFFGLQGLPKLSRPEWKVHGYIAAPKVVEGLKVEGRNLAEVCESLQQFPVN